MLFNLVKKDFKGKYRHSLLGYLWHLITPLSMILVYYIVFNAIFGKGIPDYWLYLSSAIFALNFFSSSMVSNTSTITRNSRMITKMAFPREILIISNVIINAINLIISYAILIVFMLITGTSISVNLFFIPLIILLESVFITGVGLLLSALNVYVRDIENGIRIIQMLLIFVTPCFYMVDNMGTLLQCIVSFNPLAYYVNFVHDVMYFAITPDICDILLCFILAVMFLVMGAYVFKRLEHGFAERL